MLHKNVVQMFKSCELLRPLFLVYLTLMEFANLIEQVEDLVTFLCGNALVLFSVFQI